MDTEGEYIDGTNPNHYVGFARLMIEVMQEASTLQLYQFAHRRGHHATQIGKDFLTEEEITLIKKVMHECISTAISSVFYEIDNPSGYLRSLKIYADGNLISGEDKLQGLLYSENWFEKFGGTDHINDSGWYRDR